MGRKPRIFVTVAAAAAAAALLLLLFLALPLLIPAERFLPLIEKQASGFIGLPVSIEELRLKPGLGVLLEASGVRVGQSSDSPDLAVEEFTVSLRLWPLLRGEVRLARLGVEGVRLRLQRSADTGRWSVAGMPGSMPPGEERSDHPEASGEDPEPGGLELPVDRIDLRDVRAVFTDPTGAGELRNGVELGPVRAFLERQRPGLPWRFELGLALGGARRETLNLSGVVPVSGGAHTDVNVELVDLDLQSVRPLLTVVGASLPGAVRSGMARGTLRVRGAGTGQGAAERPALVPGFLASGKLEVSGLQVDLGSGAHSRTLGADLSVAVDADRLRVELLRVALDDQALEGSLDYQAGAPAHVQGDLRSARLDLDSVLALLSGLEKGAARPTAAGAATGAGGSALAGGLDLAVDSARLIGLELAEARVKVELAAGRLELKHVACRLYGGELKGSGALEPGLEPLPFRLRAQAGHIDLEGALAALSPDLDGLLTGRFTGDLKLDGKGIAPEDLSRSLRGALSLELRDGRLMSVSILGQVAELLEIAGGRGIGKENTPYESIRGDFEVRAGKASTRNLAVRSEDLDLDGEGAFGLDATLDFDVEGRFSPAVSRDMVAKTPSLAALVGEDERLKIRFRLHGPLAEPKVELDRDYLRQSLKRAAEQKGKEKLLEKLQDLLR